MNVVFTSGGPGGKHALAFTDLSDAEACMVLGIAEGIAKAMRRDDPPPEPALEPHRPKLGGLPTREQAKILGYEGDPCNDCGQFMMVRNGTCLKCDGCGATSGCS